MDAVVVESLNSLETHLNSLVTSLTQTNTFANAPQIAKDLLSADDNLTDSLNLLRRHQQNYAHILNLRAEVATLQEQLKDTVRRCVALRQEISQIHPSIVESLDSDEEEEDTEVKVAEIDYHTLLAFAARIGKHNAAAAREAEAEAIRRKVAAKNKTSATTNGVTGSADQATGNGKGNGNGNENATAETEAELERINTTIALSRAQLGMAFPDVNVLRVGALGQLQLFQERQQHATTNDEEVQAALEREVERMVRETEDIAEPKVEQTEEGTETWPSPEMSKRSIDRPGLPGAPLPSATQPSQTRAAAPASAPAPKRKLDLDFPSSDEEDEG